MAKVFGILTAVILAIAAFVALKNKGAYATELENRAVAEDRLAQSKTRLSTAESEHEAAKQLLSDTQAEVERSKTQQSEQEAANQTLTTDIAAKKPQLEENKTKLDGIREQTERLGDIRGLAAKLRNMLSEGEELKQSIDTGNAALNNLTAENNRLEASIADQKRESDLLSKGESLPDLETRIRSVYPNWGFVTLADGNNAGVATNSTLDVIRGDETIAKLLVTAVEGNSASASIIPDTLAEGVTLAPGDQVVPGQKVSE